MVLGSQKEKPSIKGNIFCQEKEWAMCLENRTANVKKSLPCGGPLVISISGNPEWGLSPVASQILNKTRKPASWDQPSCIQVWESYYEPQHKALGLNLDYCNGNHSKLAARAITFSESLRV